MTWRQNHWFYWVVLRFYEDLLGSSRFVLGSTRFALGSTRFALPVRPSNPAEPCRTQQNSAPRTNPAEPRRTQQNLVEPCRTQLRSIWPCLTPHGLASTLEVPSIRRERHQTCDSSASEVSFNHARSTFVMRTPLPVVRRRGYPGTRRSDRRFPETWRKARERVRT